MRFVLDNCVDAAVGRMLRKTGHECWTADNAGLQDAEDDALSAYAQSKAAVLITHDREFSNRRKDFVVGRHVRLDCDDLHALEVMTRDLPRMLPLLGSTQDVYIRTSLNPDTWDVRW